MHNLFLGTGKRIFKLWLSRNMISKEDLEVIERRIRSFTVPRCVGRLPTNIVSNYGGYTASQWQSWILYYSVVLLKGILPNSHFQCWLLFVRACSILCQRIIKKSDVETADLLLLSFCKKVEHLYGKESCTPNLHLHLHLKQCILDYGPSHTFWCYSFERFNGLLGSYHTNKKIIEVQIMRKFVNSQCLNCLKSNVLPDLAPFLPSTSASPVLTENVLSDDENFLSFMQMSSSRLPSVSFHNTGIIKCLPPLYENVFSAENHEYILGIYNELYPEFTVENVSPFFIKCGRVLLGGQLIGSMVNVMSSNTSAVITAFWPTKSTHHLRTIDYRARQYECWNSPILL